MCVCICVCLVCVCVCVCACVEEEAHLRSGWFGLYMILRVFK